MHDSNFDYSKRFAFESAGFERTHLDAKGRAFLGERIGESSHSPLGRVVRRVARKGQATT